MGEAFILKRGGGSPKINGQTEEIVRFTGTINKGDPVCISLNPVKLSNPSVLPAGNGRCVVFSNSGEYLVVGHDNTPHMTIYKRNGVIFTKLSDSSSLPPSAAYCVTFDPTDTYLVVGHSISPYISIYKREGDTFTKLANPSTLPTGYCNGVAFDPSSTYLAVAHGTNPYLTIYKREGDTFTKLVDPSQLPTGTAHGVAFNRTGTHLAVTGLSPYACAYGRNGDTFGRIHTFSGLSNAAYGVAYDPQGDYLVIGSTSNPYLAVYTQVSSSSYSAATVPTYYGTSFRSLMFDSSGTFLVAGCDSYPYQQIYRHLNGTLVFLDIFSGGMASAQVYGAAIDKTSTFMAFVGNGSPYVHIYTAASCVGTGRTKDLMYPLKVGYAKESGITGEFKKVVIIVK